MTERIKWVVERRAVMDFRIGDHIGRGQQPIGVITISEAIESPTNDDWWHLAWIVSGEEGTTYHWRGPQYQRDTRWTIESYTIKELP